MYLERVITTLRWFSGAVVAAVVAVLLVPLAPADAASGAYVLPLRDGVITAPGAPTAAASLPVYVVYDAPATSSSWQLLPSGTDTVAVTGPAPTASGSFVINPTAANGGVPLADGQYQLRLVWTDDTGTHATDPWVAVSLAQDPPVEFLSTSPTIGDMIPSTRRGHHRDATALIHTMPRVGYYAKVPDGVFTVRNAAGTALRSRTIAATCIRDGIFCIPDEHVTSGDYYEWSWDGTVNGRQQPAGRYQLTARLPDRFGRIVDVDLGDFWIRHLETRRAIDVLPAADIRTDRYSMIGRCSSVTAPGPHGWAGSIGLLSKSRCRSGLGTADWAFQTLGTNLRAALLDRVVRMRVDGYGAPARAGSRGSIVMAVDLARSGPVWRRTTVLGAGLGWHIGQLREVAPRYGIHLNKLTQARVTDGNRYDLQYVRYVYDYRTWVR